MEAKGTAQTKFDNQKIGDDIKYFLKIHREARRGMGVEQIVKHLQLAGEDNTFELSQLKKGANGLEMRNT